MKFKGELMFTELGEEAVAIPVGEAGEKLHGIFHMNETGKTICSSLAQGFDVDTIVEKLIQEYEVDKQTAREAVQSVIERLRSWGLIEE